MGSRTFRGPPAREENRHLWWALSPVYTAGVVAFVPAVHAAVTLGRRELWYWAAGLVGADIVVWLLANGAAETAVTNAGAALAMVVAVAGTVLAFRVRGEVFPRRAAGPSSAFLDPAVAEALTARQRRAESMDLATRDLPLARHLRIGRPDLSRNYDDGGLVDINHVPARIFCTHLDFSPEQARLAVAARETVGRFEGPDDLGNTTELDPRVVDRVRDRIVAL